jgi:hypothetical protein
VFDQFEEVAPNHWLAPTNVDVENLHRRNLVNEILRFTRREFTRVAPSGR